jgi:hypothetical protein
MRAQVVSGSPSIRHTAAGNGCTTVAEKPAAVSAATPFPGCCAQPASSPPPKWPKSTMTVTPELSVQAPGTDACALGAAPAAPPPSEAATTASATASARRGLLSIRRTRSLHG